jgi:DNA-binding CsgD family transcriptional regulator
MAALDGPPGQPPVPTGLSVTPLALNSENLVVFSFEVPRSRQAGLSKTEREIARLLAEGLSNADIARARRRSVHTVSNQVASIFRKLRITSRLQLTGRW